MAALVVPVALGVLFVALGAGSAQSEQGERPILPLFPSRTPTPTALPPPPPPPPQVQGYEAADAVGSTVTLYDSPGGSAFHTLTNPTRAGLPLVLAVRQHGPSGWLLASVPMRPNGTQAWVRAEEVTLRTVPNMIVIELGARTLRVLQGGTNQEVLSAPIAIGKGSTPTPLGEFYVDGRGPGGGPYGSMILSVAGYSEVYETFGNGIGQIAIHGTNRPELIGQAVSNGCIRMFNSDIEALALLAPDGTPVSIRG